MAKKERIPKRLVIVVSKSRWDDDVNTIEVLIGNTTFKLFELEREFNKIYYTSVYDTKEFKKKLKSKQEVYDQLKNAQSTDIKNDEGLTFIGKLTVELSAMNKDLNNEITSHELRQKELLQNDFGVTDTKEAFRIWLVKHKGFEKIESSEIENINLQY